MEVRSGWSTVALAADLARFGERVALVTGTGAGPGDEQITYADLAGRVADVGSRLGPARRLVLVAGGSDVGSVVAYLGALAAGHVVLLSQDTPEAVARLVATYDPDAVVHHGDLEIVREGTAHDLHPDLALLLSTSGTTGSPRLVRLGAAGVQANAEAIADYLSVRDSDVAVTTLPLHYCYGLSVLHSHLVRGAAVALSTLSVLDACFWDLVRDRGVTSISGVPHTFDLLDRVGFGSGRVPSLRYLTQAGGRMAPQKVRRYAELGQRHGFDLFVMYGQTEATARMAYLPPDLAADHPGAVGVPVPGGALSIEDPDPLTGVGELVYAGPNVMLGYASCPADLARPREVSELRTGDLARRDSAGLVEVVGRTARFAKIYGLRVDLDRVEHLLGDDGLTVACASNDNRLVVAVVCRRRLGRRALAARAQARAREATSLPPSAVRVVVVDDLPRLPSGKPDPSAVLALAEGTGTSGGADGPLPRDVRGTFALVLGRDRVVDGDTFTSLGGDSLSYVEMSVRLEELLGDLPPDWHQLTVAELEATRRPDTPRRRSRVVETGVLVRALAIVAIVATHGNLLTLPGGAHVLLGVIGFNLARFSLTAVPAAERSRRLARSALRIAVPTVLWVGGVTLLTGAYPWRTALLLNGVAGPRDWAEPAWHLWFAEAAVVTLAGVAVLVALPVVDRAERRWPFWLPVALAVVALSTRYGLVELRGGDDIHRAHVTFWLVALGWAAARATTWRHRAVVSVLLVLTVPGFFADPGREAVVVLGLLALVWVSAVRVPALVARVAGTLAAASLWTYLTHWQVYPHLEDRWPWAAVAASLVVGVLAWRAWAAAQVATSRLVGHLRPSRVGPPRGSRRPAPVPQRRASGGGSVSAVSPASSTGRAPGTTLTATGTPGS